VKCHHTFTAQGQKAATGPLRVVYERCFEGTTTAQELSWEGRWLTPGISGFGDALDNGQGR